MIFVISHNYVKTTVLKKEFVITDNVNVLKVGLEKIVQFKETNKHATFLAKLAVDQPILNVLAVNKHF